MAGLWSALRSEVMGTVDDIRQKGAISVLRDAALDAKDLATNAGSAVVGGVRGLVAEDEEEDVMPILRFAGVPSRGATAPLEFPDGRTVEAVVSDVDGISEPPRATVTFEGAEEPMLVAVLAPGAPRSEVLRRGGLLETLKQDWQATMQDIREKGAVGAVRDAALDAADIVGGTAKGVYQGARAMTGDLLAPAGCGDGSDSPQGAAAEGGAAARGVAEDGAADASAATEASAEASSSTAPTTSGGLLDAVRREVTATVQDVREKGAVRVVKDGVLDAVDMVGSTASTMAAGAKSMASDLTSKCDDDEARTRGAGADGDGAGAEGGGLLDGLKSVGKATVQEFREKGAVGAVKDAALDAVDLLGNTATKVAGHATSLAEKAPHLQDFWAADAPAVSSGETAAAASEAAGVATGAAAGAAASSSGTASSSSTPAAFAPPARTAGGAAVEQKAAEEAGASKSAAADGEVGKPSASPMEPQEKAEGAQAKKDDEELLD